PYLDYQFISGDYKRDYSDFVRTVVQGNKQHPNIYAWEPGSELQDPDKAAFLAMMQDTTRLIKELDPDHPVADGMTEAKQSGFTPDELYPYLPDVDIVTVHPGNGYRESAIDVDWAMSHGKKAIVEENGVSAFDDRTERFRGEMDFWRSKGVSAYLLDGFIAKGLPDTGDGDTVLGFDALWHTDYDQLARLLRSESGR
ncbi:MAG TPA: hypothetical protein VKU60_11010, partial [Chloroflexota bacterium]|nr:hypothetical protein [Chloroflexota bacterium]